MITFDDTKEAHILMRVWEELGGSPALQAATGSEFAEVLADVQPDEGVVVMTHDGQRKWQYTDEAGELLRYRDVPVVQARVVYGFSCFQSSRSPLRKARSALLCTRWANNVDLVSLLFALARSKDPFDVNSVRESCPTLPSTWDVHLRADQH